VRNLSALFATTLFSLYTLYFNPDAAYPKTLEGKLEALDFDTMMSSNISFKCFYDFIDDYAVTYKPYMHIYIMTKMYQEQVETMMHNNEKKASMAEINRRNEVIDE
jgi:hypothetical protein